MDDSVATPPPEPPRQNLARVQAVPWLLFIAMLGIAAWLGIKAFGADERGDPVAGALLAFEKQNSLTVFTARFDVLASSIDERGVLGVDLLKSEQVVAVPALVEYRLDLSGVGRERLAWDAEKQVLSIRLPPPRISKPNIDEGKARVFTKGVWVTSEAQNDLRRNNAEQAERKAQVFASQPEILAMARKAAREAVRQNLAVPLQVAGFEDASVTVRFDGEAAD
jgi:hypothetical protein